VKDSRYPLLLRPPQGVENKSPLECRGLLGGGSKQSRPKNRGRMTFRLGVLGQWAYPYTPTSQWGWRSARGPQRGCFFGGHTGFNGCVH